MEFCGDKTKDELIEIIIDNDLLSHRRIKSFLICEWIRNNYGKITKKVPPYIQRSKKNKFGRIVSTTIQNPEYGVHPEKPVSRTDLMYMAAEHFHVSYEYVRYAWYYYYGDTGGKNNTPVVSP